MKKFVLIILCVFVTSICNAQKIRYTYKPLTREGCRVTFTASFADEKKYIYVMVEADQGMSFSANPEMLLKTFDDEVLKLNGENLGSTRGGSVWNGSGAYGAAQFLITDEQVSLLQKGIKKIRLSTLPWIHEREFSTDKIGKKLYKAFKSNKKTTELDDF